MDITGFATRPVRAGSTVLRVYNEGLTGLVYDRANEAVIRRSGALMLHGIGRAVYADAKSTRLRASGTLLVFGLHGDGELALELVVGPPLDAAELGAGPWLESGPAYVELPSGALRLHSYDSLPMGDNDGPTEHPGAEAQLPSGRYEARLYRKDFRALPAAQCEALEAARRDGSGCIDDVLVLTPMAVDAPSPSSHNVLFGECIGFEDPALQAPRVVDGVWSGRVVDVPDDTTVAIDLTEADADRLGLRCGARLLVCAGDVELPVFHMGGSHVSANWGLAFGSADTQGMPPGAVAKACFATGRVDGSRFSEERLELRSIGNAHALAGAAVGTAVTARVDPAPYVPMPPPATAAKGIAHGVVIGSTGHGLLTSIDDKLLRKLKLAPGEKVEIDVDGHRFVAAQAVRQGRGTGAAGAPADSPPTWCLVQYVPDPARAMFGLQVDRTVRALATEAQQPYLLPRVAVGTPVSVRRHAAPE
jgi:hypothetical protein